MIVGFFAALVLGAGVDDPAQWDEWIADGERPAEEYRGRYQIGL